MLNIFPGLYHDHDKRLCNVIGVSQSTEQGPPLVIFQEPRAYGVGRMPLRHVSLSEFVYDPQKRFTHTTTHPHGAHVIGIDDPDVPGIFGHWKGNRYNVIGVAMTREDTEAVMVYQPLYGEHQFKLSHRPLAMFMDEVDRTEPIVYKGPRFRRIQAFSAPRIITRVTDLPIE